MSWGKGILITFIIFAIAIISFVTISMRQNIDLVTGDYYSEELKYQDKINRMSDAGRLEQKLVIERKGNTVDIIYPVALSGDIKGKVNFYRPSDARKDFTVQVAFDAEGRQSIDTGKLDKGSWRVGIEWQLNSSGLYNEEYIFID